MEPERAKALTKCCRMIRMALDTRTPEGERQAATDRARAVARRWQLTESELVGETQRLMEDEESHDERRQRHAEALKAEALRRDRQAAAEAGMNAGFGPHNPADTPLRIVHLEDGRVIITGNVGFFS